MKKLGFMVVNKWLSYLFGSVVVVILVIPCIPKSIDAANFSCPPPLSGPPGSGDVSCLIAKINDANQNGEENTINLAAGTYTLTSIDNGPSFNANGLPVIIGAVIINGESAETTLIERDPGAPEFRIFDVDASGRLTLNGLSVRGGSTGFLGGGIQNIGILTISRSILTNNDSTLGGGGIHNRGATSIMSSSITHNASENAGGVDNLQIPGFPLPTMIIQNSTISDNSAFDLAGGLFNSGSMIIMNSTIADNRTGFGGGGGGIANEGMLTITNSTIAHNTAGTLVGLGDGGGISNAGTVKLRNTIVALNSADFGSDCTGPITSLGNNIIGDPSNCGISLLSSDLMGDPGLGAFMDDGSPGNGHFPLNPGSQAVDAGNSGACPETDQLGFPRIGICDIGAIEFQDGRLLVSVDIRPRSDANKINPNSTKDINVAIFSGNGFDATTVDPNTVRFGATGTEAAPIHVARRDVNGDGHRDVVVRFQIQDTGIKCGDTSAILTGQISNGSSIIGSSPITTVQCKQPQISAKLK